MAIRQFATDAEIAAARDIAEGMDGVEVDIGAKVSLSDRGVWVAAWVWVPNENVNERIAECKKHDESPTN